MTELRPLRIASNQAVSRLLLESALEDHSAPGAADRALQALSSAALVATTAVTVQAAASPCVGSHFAGGIVVKWLGLGLVAGATTLLSAERVMHAISEAKESPKAPAPHSEKPPARQPNRVTVAAATPEASDSTPPAPRTQRPVDVPPLRVADRALPAAAVSQPDGEPLQQLHAIRRAIADRAPERALTLLDLFVTRYPASSLLEEAAVLRFDALLVAGRSEARAEGQSFLRRYPRSAYAERVRSKLSALP